MDDPLWPRASTWLVSHGDASASPAGRVDVAVLGVPAHQTSISATRADTTPSAIRDALARYSTYSTGHGVDVASVRAVDYGDVDSPDFEEGEARVADAVGRAAGARLVVALGGDNSVTYSVARAAWGAEIRTAGLVTLDAHHDLRDGISNGSPVRRLIEAGLQPRFVVQIGIADFANSAEYSARARDLGITVISRTALRNRTIDDAVAEAIGIAADGGGPIHVDFDVDVCDRAVAPACPASVPGGISADELRRAAFLVGRSPRVQSMDICEIDAAADTPDGRTVRLGALLLLEAAAGVASR